MGCREEQVIMQFLHIYQNLPSLKITSDLAELFQQHNIHRLPRYPGKTPMLAVPPELAQHYEARVAQRNVMARQRPHDHQ